MVRDSGDTEIVAHLSAVDRTKGFPDGAFQAPASYL